MKIRRDFVTNSSSSSFIVTDVNVTDEILKTYFKEVNKDNIISSLLEFSDFYCDVDEEIEILRKFEIFTEEHINISLLWRAGLLTEYNRIMGLLNDDKTVYLVSYLNNNLDIYNKLYFGNLGTVLCRFDN